LLAEYDNRLALAQRLRSGQLSFEHWQEANAALERRLNVLQEDCTNAAVTLLLKLQKHPRDTNENVISRTWIAARAGAEPTPLPKGAPSLLGQRLARRGRVP